MHSKYEGTFLQAELLSLSCYRDTNRVVEEVVVQFVQLSFVNALVASNAFKFHLKGRCYTLLVFCNA